MLGQRAGRALYRGATLVARRRVNTALPRQTWPVQQFRRLTAMFAVGVALAGCNVTESSRSGGLVPPTGPAPTAATTAATVVTVTAADNLTSIVTGSSGSDTDGLPSATHDTLPLEPTPTTPSSTDPVPTGTADGGLLEAQEVLAAAVPLEDFSEGVLGVSGPAGTRVWPVIIADTPAARQRGLMGVSDFAALGGYAAMVFIFDADTDGAFWMRDTPLPLA